MEFPIQTGVFAQITTETRSPVRKCKKIFVFPRPIGYIFRYKANELTDS